MVSKSRYNTDGPSQETIQKRIYIISFSAPMFMSNVDRHYFLHPNYVNNYKAAHKRK